MLAVLLLLAAAPWSVAQQPAPSALPRAVAREAADVYNATATLRSMGPFTVDSGETVHGDLAVLDGPLVVAGRVTGRVVAINADVELRPGAEVEGGVLVVGGRLTGRDLARIGDDARVYADRLAYQEIGDRLVLADDDETNAAEEWWERWRARRDRSGTRFLITSGKTYNRVEGLPVMAGPVYRGRFDWGQADVDLLGILRTADEARWDADNLGHHARAELRLGRWRGALLGAEHYDVVRPVEDWHLQADEVGLAAAFLHRDYRDYFGRHGGAVFAGIYAGPDAEIRLRYADERWRARLERDPFSVFRNGDPWRPNPWADEGEMGIFGATLRVDTRNVENRPLSGWYVVADYERGSGRLDQVVPAPPPGGGNTQLGAGDRTYGRGFLDVRRYNRVSPSSRLNLRMVLGGWLHGDPLPAQRRFSVGGPGTLPGYDFRSVVGDADLNQCSTGGVAPLGSPAQCDRVILLQAEYRGDIRFSLGLDDVLEIRDHRWRRSQWVAFVNTGRGWLLGTPPSSALPGEAPLWVARDRLPGLSTFRTDVGVGLDLGLIGVYVAKAVSEPGQRANFYVRLHERF